MPIVIGDANGDKLEYKEAMYSVGRYMGERNYHASQMWPAGIVPAKSSWRPQEIYDLRIVDRDGEAQIRRFDEAIAAIQKERQEFIEDKFATWRIPTREDCETVKAGKPKAEAEAEAKAKNKDPNAGAGVDLRAEREIVGFINRGMARP